jgi:hypothetical protein
VFQTHLSCAHFFSSLFLPFAHLPVAIRSLSRPTA